MTTPKSLYFKNLEPWNQIKDLKTNKQKTKEKTPADLSLFKITFLF